jgi:hypothetical protein
MGDTWTVDLYHYAFPDEKALQLPRQALRLAEYFASIIEATIRNASFINGPIGVRCSKRPGRRACAGWVQAELSPEGNELYWQCPVCGDKGCISSWKGTRWDPARKQNQSGLHSIPEWIAKDIDKEPQKIQGTSEWDKTLQRLSLGDYRMSLQQIPPDTPCHQSTRQ